MRIFCVKPPKIIRKILRLIFAEKLKKDRC